VRTRLAATMEDSGCLSLFGRKPEQHRLASERLTAEHRVRTEGRGRTVDEWKLGGCAVAASVMGATLLGAAVKSEPCSTMRLSTIQKAKR
jgi:hypothetical protein